MVFLCSWTPTVPTTSELLKREMCRTNGGSSSEVPLTPSRFHGDEIPGYDDILSSFVDEGLIRRLTPDE